MRKGNRVGKGVEEAIIKAMCRYPQKPITQGILGGIIKASPSVISQMKKGKANLTEKHVKRFAEKYNLSSEEIVSWGNINHCNQEGECASNSNIIPDSNRRRFLTGLCRQHQLIGDAMVFRSVFGHEEEKQFLQDGIIPPKWQSLITSKEDFGQFVSRFIQETYSSAKTPKKERSKKTIPGGDLPRANNDLKKEAERRRIKFSNLPDDILRAYIVGTFAAGVIEGKGIQYGEEVFMGALMKVLSVKYNLQYNQQSGIVSIVKKVGKRVEYQIDINSISS